MIPRKRRPNKTEARARRRRAMRRWRERLRGEVVTVPAPRVRPYGAKPRYCTECHAKLNSYSGTRTKCLPCMGGGWKGLL